VIIDKTELLDVVSTGDDYQFSIGSNIWVSVQRHRAIFMQTMVNEKVHHRQHRLSRTGPQATPIERD
jgi:hypothetical protein